MVKSSPVTQKPRLGPNLDSTGGVSTLLRGEAYQGLVARRVE